jgi:hypothetical protein
MPDIKPMDTAPGEVPGSTGNDMVTNYQGDNLYAGQPLDVYNYLETPGNMGDTTQVIYGPQAPAPYDGSLCFATEYIAAFPTVYPDITLPS